MAISVCVFGKLSPLDSISPLDFWIARAQFVRFIQFVLPASLCVGHWRVEDTEEEEPLCLCEFPRWNKCNFYPLFPPRPNPGKCYTMISRVVFFHQVSTRFPSAIAIWLICAFRIWCRGGSGSSESCGGMGGRVVWRFVLFRLLLPRRRLWRWSSSLRGELELVWRSSSSFSIDGTWRLMRTL